MAEKLGFDENEIGQLRTIMTFREDVAESLIRKVELRPDCSDVILKVVLSNPRLDLEQLELQIDQAIATHSMSHGPYEDERLNLAYFEAKNIGRAVEFEEAIRLLGDSVDPDDVVKKLQPKLDENAFISRYGTLINAMEALGVIRASSGQSGYRYGGKAFSNLLDALIEAHQDATKASSSKSAGTYVTRELGDTYKAKGFDKAQAASMGETQSGDNVSVWRYIFAWLCWGFLGSIVGYVFGAVYGASISGALISSMGLKIFVVGAFLIDIFSRFLSYKVIYEWTFKSLDPTRVLPYFYVLGTLGFISLYAGSSRELSVAYGNSATLSEPWVIAVTMLAWLVCLLAIRRSAFTRAAQMKNS